LGSARCACPACATARYPRTTRGRCCARPSASGSTSSTPPGSTAARRSSSPTRCTPTRTDWSSRPRAGCAPAVTPTAGPNGCANCEDSLRRLRVDTIDLWQLHRIDQDVPFEEQFGTIRDLRDEGKIRFAGISEVSVDQLRRAQALVAIATVQNRYNATEGQADDVLAARRSVRTKAVNELRLRSTPAE